MLKSRNGQAALIQAKPKLNIQFKRKRQAKKQLCKNKEVFIFFTPKKVVLEPHREITLIMQIQIDYPPQLIPEFMLLPSLTKMKIEAEISDYRVRDFYQIKLFNKCFSDTIKIENNTGIVAMYFLNDKNYILNIKSSYIQTFFHIFKNSSLLQIF